MTVTAVANRSRELGDESCPSAPPNWAALLPATKQALFAEAAAANADGGYTDFRGQLNSFLAAAAKDPRNATIVDRVGLWLEQERAELEGFPPPPQHFPDYRQAVQDLRGQRGLDWAVWALDNGERCEANAAADKIPELVQSSKVLPADVARLATKIESFIQLRLQKNLPADQESLQSAFRALAIIAPNRADILYGLLAERWPQSAGALLLRLDVQNPQLKEVVEETVNALGSKSDAPKK